MEIDDGDIDWYGRADDGMLGLGCGSSGSWGGVGEDLGRVPFSGSLRGRRGIARSATTVVGSSNVPPREIDRATMRSRVGEASSRGNGMLTMDPNSG